MFSSDINSYANSFKSRHRDLLKYLFGDNLKKILILIISKINKNWYQPNSTPFFLKLLKRRTNKIILNVTTKSVTENHANSCCCF